jgi:hypothetical protein
MSFKTISYTSTLLWHFVRGSGEKIEEKENNSFSIFVESDSNTEIFNGNGIGTLLCVPPKRSKYHSRKFVLEGSGSIMNQNSDGIDLNQSLEYLVKEPRSICFADIPINHLPRHIDRYYGIGLGFRKDIIVSKVSDLKPVEYYPRKTTFTLENSCEVFFDGTTTPLTLKKYAKIPSQDETFEQIYHEREWRTFNDVKFTNEELAMIFFPSKKILQKALNHPRFQKFINSGVGYICGEDLFEENSEKVL